MTLVKANLQIYDAGKKGTAADTHWHRLLTTDQCALHAETQPRHSRDTAETQLRPAHLTDKCAARLLAAYLGFISRQTRRDRAAW